ncbi:hypothetical protein R3P38DRAFT_3346403 [Favolaschia claudopus]|uniref:Uncharacterized protein n=1 Tax=Favolaschia claudopus TaxID=2862362 RepID=A0AAW0D610_9AGAR
MSHELFGLETDAFRAGEWYEGKRSLRRIIAELDRDEEQRDYAAPRFWLVYRKIRAEERVAEGGFRPAGHGNFEQAYNVAPAAPPPPYGAAVNGNPWVLFRLRGTRFSDPR